MEKMKIKALKLIKNNNKFLEENWFLLLNLAYNKLSLIRTNKK